MPFDRARIKEPPKLAVPEKEPGTRHRFLSENYFFGMQVELLTQAIQFRQNKQEDQDSGNKPSPVKKSCPLFGNDQMPCYSATYGDKGKHPLGHHRAGGKYAARQQLPKAIFGICFIQMINRSDDQSRQV